MNAKEHFDYMMEIYDDVFERNLKASIWEQGIEKGMEQGIEKGMEQGAEKGRTEQLRKFVLTLHERGYDVEAIANLTGSTRKIVEEILRS